MHSEEQTSQDEDRLAIAALAISAAPDSGVIERARQSIRQSPLLATPDAKADFFDDPSKFTGIPEDDDA